MKEQFPMQTRRELMKRSAVVATWLAAAGVLPANAQSAWMRAAFEGKSVDEVIKALGLSKPVESIDIVFTAPDIAENGAVVPVAVASKIAGTQSIMILVEKNPSSLAAEFEILPGTEANVGTRVKMGQSSNIHAVVKAGGKYYVATKEVKVTLGGCGG